MVLLVGGHIIPVWMKGQSFLNQTVIFDVYVNVTYLPIWLLSSFFFDIKTYFTFIQEVEK